jgi:hypothetical protein
MKELNFKPPSRAALCLLLCSCGGDLLVGEKRCYGEGVDCSSEAPTLPPLAGEAVAFDVEASRNVEPVWIYDPPIERSSWGPTQLAPAPGGGVWAYHASETHTLERINAEGEPVELHLLNYGGMLSVNDELSPILLLGLSSGHVVQTVLGPQGEVLEQTVGRDPIVEVGRGSFVHFLIAGPRGRVRSAMFRTRGSYLAEHSPLGELLWKQTELRGARGFPPEDPSDVSVAASYRAVTLSDGAIALGVPKDGPIQFGPAESFGGQWDHAQGITLVGADGNVRWDKAVNTPTYSVLLAPGPDGSVVMASGDFALNVVLLDRDGNESGRWVGQRAGYFGPGALALCSDASGDIYALALTGKRQEPLPTVCRMRGSDPSAEVVCLGVEGLALIPLETAGLTLASMTAPEPGAVVFSVEQRDVANETSNTRLVRIEFF